MSKVELIAAKARLREEGYSGEIVHKAVEKAKRWMKAAYGDIDWDELEAECGVYDALKLYASECLSEPKGLRTFNRG